MRAPHLRASAALALALVLAAGLAGPAAAPATGQALDAPPPLAGRAASLLPPGNSGFVSAQGQAQGAAGGSYGDNLDDQSDLYWGLEGYAGQGFADPADAVRVENPVDGVRIYWDAFGVPAIYGDTGRDVWFGAGYAVAQLRLFLLDAVRRMGRGTFAELVGTPGVPTDVQTRTLTYGDAEYEAMFAELSQDAQDAVEGYVDGVNAWIAEATADPRLLPAEYELLTTTPEPLDVIDVLAAGVFITRFVASEGGQEMENVALLRELEAAEGEAAGRAVFRDLVWATDPAALATVPREEGTFANQPLSDPAPDALGHVGTAAFERLADWAVGLPDALDEGPGTGAFPEPAPLPDPPIPSAPQGAVVAARAAEALVEGMRSLRGGSIAVAIGPSRTADGGALLLSGPQLGYSYPPLLVELEVHGGGYDARGVSVPSLPTVGIGHTDRVAWALTTGYSKTIDSFVEQVRGPSGALEHLHEGTWKPTDCRTEVIRFRESAQGAPVGPPSRSVEVPVCRTVHGPVVAAEDGEGERLARAVQYMMWGRELETVEGILAWNRADSLEEFEAGVRLVTWNENTTYADADGRIAYWHPGVHLARPTDADQRLPLPGDGSFDFGDPLPFEDLPQAVDPLQGFLVNWNNVPAAGWLDGVGVGPTSRPGGPFQRAAIAVGLAGSRTDHDLASLQALEQEAGLQDVRADAFLPLLLPALREQGGRLAEVADLLAAWNGRHHDPLGAPTLYAGPGGTSDGTTDGPAATTFDAIVEALLDDLLSDVPPALVERQRGVGSHVYDASPAHNLVLRVLDPTSSGLRPSRDYARGRTAEQVLVDAAEAALADLATTYGSQDLQDYRRPTARSEVDNLSGVIGPSTTQPYMDRGSWVSTVAFDPALLPVERAAGAERVATAVLASAAAFPDGSQAVVVASARTFPDALSAAPLAAALDAPLLLVDGGLREDVAAEVARLGARDAVVVGGEAAVPPAVADALVRQGLAVDRVGGPDRYATSAAVARRVVGLGGAAAAGAPDAYVVSGDVFPDALAVGAVAGRVGAPVLLTRRDVLPTPVEDVVEQLGFDTTAVVGGEAVISAGVEAVLPEPSRIAGADRYATAAAVLRHARDLDLPADALVVATGADFPDGLGAGAAAAALDGLVVLVDGRVPTAPGEAFEVARTLQAAARRLLVVGGPAAVDPAIVELLR
jgi:penicillin G amidase